MRGQHVEFYDHAAAEAGIVAGDVESGEEVAEDARHGLQLVGRDGVAVDRARGLARQPLVDARRAEGMFTLRRLKINNKENLYRMNWNLEIQFSSLFLPSRDYKSVIITPSHWQLSYMLWMGFKP